jgi:hypothetical protein
MGLLLNRVQTILLVDRWIIGNIRCARSKRPPWILALLGRLGNTQRSMVHCVKLTTLRRGWWRMLRCNKFSEKHAVRVLS